MANCNNLKVDNYDLEKCLLHLEICDNPMECVQCSFLLEKLKGVVIEDTISSLDKIPKQITKITIPILPVPQNKYYYSFDGIETIIFNFFRTESKIIKKELEDKKVFLKVFYKKSSFFTLPIIQLEIIFIDKLKKVVIDDFWNKLNSTIITFTASVGDIDIIDLENSDHLSEILNSPLLIGYPEFRLNGELLYNDFSIEQIKQMNYLHTINLIQLDMSRTINNNQLQLFGNQNQIIRDGLESEFNYLEGIDIDILNKVINSLFPEEDEDIVNSTEDIDDIKKDLPF